MFSNTQKVVKGVSSQTIVTIVLGVVEIVSFSIMSRLLGQKDFGYYAAIVAVAAVFQSSSETGIGASIVQKKDLNQNYINNAFSLSFIFGIVIAGLLCALSGFIAGFIADDSITIPLRLFSITLICSCLSSVYISLMQRKLQFIRIGLINLSSLVITTTIAVILALKGFGYYAILTKAVLQSVLILVISYFAAQTKFSLAFDKSEYKSIFNFSGWLMFSAVFRNIANQTDRLLMTSLLSVETLGFYTRPKEFINNISGKFNVIFDSALFPVLSEIQDEREKLNKSFHYAVYFLNTAGMLISLGFFCNSELIIRVFFGEEWLNVNTLFMVLSVYPILLINGRLGDVFLRTLALTKQQFFFRVGQFAFAITFILIGYRFGIIAVAVSIMSSYFCITAIKITFLMKKMNLKTLDIITTITKSFQFSVFVLPVFMGCKFFLPATLTGNIISAVIFLLTTGLLFFVLPKLVGKKYHEEAYSKVLSFVKKRK